MKKVFTLVPRTYCLDTHTPKVASDGKHSSNVLYTGYLNKLQNFNIPVIFIHSISKIKYRIWAGKHSSNVYIEDIQN
jgi:hypothetical protein